MTTVNVTTGMHSIPLGRRRESLVRQIVFDISDWVEEYGEGVVTLTHQRAKDERPYMVNLAVNGNQAIWNVIEYDTYFFGQGMCELQYTVGKAVVKSSWWLTKVEFSLSDPDRGVNWTTELVDQVIDYLADIGIDASRVMYSYDTDTGELYVRTLGEYTAPTFTVDFDTMQLLISYPSGWDDAVFTLNDGKLEVTR